MLERRLVEIRFTELPISSLHAFGGVAMPHVHKDPFDRILIAQATKEGLLLLTADPAPIKLSTEKTFRALT